MSISRPGSPPPILFGVVVFAALAILLGRGVLPAQGSPVFSSAEGGAGIRVFFGSGLGSSGIHQFPDGSTLLSVINLTKRVDPHDALLLNLVEDVELIDGMALNLASGADGASSVTLGWMPARQRLALGIALHPDRMTHEDWVTLPGIGEKLATQIECDRQNNGDFGAFDALQRVKGIGPGKMKALRSYFVSGGNLL